MSSSSSLSSQSPLAILSSVDDVLQALSLAWISDFGPIQIFAFDSIVFEHAGAASAHGGCVGVGQV